MFGVLRGASCQLDDQEYDAWWGHICGLCLTLRDSHGQASRITTNYDAALLSAVYTAQVPQAPEQRSSICALRGFRRLDVVAATDPGTQFAAAISLLLSAVRIEDQIADREGVGKRLPRLARFVARRWDRKAAKQAQATGFDTQIVQDLVHTQAAVEAQAGQPFLWYSEPTEAAVSAVFAHTATLAQKPENAAPLTEIGRMYGRIMLLLDSVSDYKEDLQNKHFNPLHQATGGQEWKKHAREIFEQAMSTIRREWTKLHLEHAQLLERLVLEILPQKGARMLYPRQKHVCRTAPAMAVLPILAAASSGGNQPPRDPNDPNRTRHMSEFPEYQNPQGQPNQQYPPQGQGQYQYPPQGQPNQQYPPQGYPQEQYYQQQYPQQGPYNQQYPPQGYQQNLPPGSYDPNQYPQQPTSKNRDGCLGLLGAGTCYLCFDRKHHGSHHHHRRHNSCGCCDCCFCCDDDCCECCGCGCCDCEDSGIECCDCDCCSCDC